MVGMLGSAQRRLRVMRVIASTAIMMLADPTVAAAKIAPVRTEIGNAQLRLRITDLTPRFLDFYAAANAPTVDADQRWQLWQQRYDFAAVPPTPKGQAMARRMLDAAWPRYAAALPTIRAGAAAMQPELLSVLDAVVAVLAPDRPVDIAVTTYVGGFEGNAFTTAQNGRPTVALPVEMNSHQRAITLPHEMAHAVHMLTAGLSGGWERSIATTLLQEGLAFHVGQVVAPQRTVREHVEFTPGWWQAAQAKRRAILKAIVPALARKDNAAVFRFTMGQGPNGIEREAYAAGWWVVDHLRRSGMSLAAIARIPEAQMPAVARRAIASLLADAPSRAR